MSRRRFAYYWVVRDSMSPSGKYWTKQLCTAVVARRRQRVESQIALIERRAARRKP